MSTKQPLAEVVEELQEEITAAYRDAIKTGDPDDLRRAQAAEHLLTRVYGKPVQPLEESPEKPETLKVLEAMTPE